MGDYCKEEYLKYKERLSSYVEIYNNNTNEGIKYLTGHGSQHAAYRYAKIHGAVIRMGGFANFSHYVNKCADEDYETFSKLEADNKNALIREKHLKLQLDSVIADNEKMRGLLEKFQLYVPMNGDRWVCDKARETLKELFPESDSENSSNSDS